MKPATIGELQIALDALDRLIQQRFQAQTEAVTVGLAAAEKAVSAALAAAKEAVNKAEAASEKRFESVNEFRSQLKDQQATLVPRAEADVRFAAMSEAIQRLSDRMSAVVSAQSQTSGKSDGANALWAIIAGLILTAIAAASLIVAVLK